MDDLNLTLAKARAAELRQEAARAHLARLATCCRPAALARLIQRLAHPSRAAVSCCP